MEKQIELIDWNTENISLKKLDNDEQYSINYEPQMNLFKQFLFKSSRYSTDQIFSAHSNQPSSQTRTEKKILFIKDLPYFVYREISTFQNLLRNFKKYSKSSLVLNMTQSSSMTELNPAKILTQDLRKELALIEVNFNQLAPTFMSKFIEKIVKLENFTFLDKNSIGEISESSDGDLRHALNTLELASVHQKLNTTSLTKKKKNDHFSLDHLTQKKDANFSLFRGLGKILHRKNIEENDLERVNVEEKLPRALLKYQRRPLSVEPEEILSKLPISDDLTNLYLHQNYLDLFNLKSETADFHLKFDHLNKVNENFIIADQISSVFSSFESSNSWRFKEIAALVSIRSVLFNMSFAEESKSRSAWMPLHKPFHFKMLEMTRAKRLSLERIMERSGENEGLRNYLVETPDEFVTNVLPFLSARKKEFREFSMKIGNFNSAMRQFKVENSKSITSNDNDPSFLQQNENLDTRGNVERKTKSSNKQKNYEYEDDFSIEIIE